MNNTMATILLKDYTFLVQAALFTTVCSLFLLAAYREMKGIGLTVSKAAAEKTETQDMETAEWTMKAAKIPVMPMKSSARVLRYFTFRNGEWEETIVPSKNGCDAGNTFTQDIKPICGGDE